MVAKKAQLSFWGEPSYFCRICHRPLSNPDSIARGIGPVCAAKQRAKEQETQDMPEFSDHHIDEPIENGFVFRRVGEHEIYTNVPHIVAHHSPQGYEWGYAGSGPSDLALNIVELVLRKINYQGATTNKVWDKSTIFVKSLELHQEFKFHFITPMAREGGVLPYETVETWVRVQSQV